MAGCGRLHDSPRHDDAGRAEPARPAPLKEMIPMHMKPLLPALAATAGLLALSSAAQAVLVYTADQSVYTAAPGETVAVDLYLTETIDTTSETSVFGTDGAIAGIDANASLSSPGSASITGFDVVDTFDADFTTIDASGDFADIQSGVISGTDLVPTLTVDGTTETRTAFLGTLSLVAGTDAALVNLTGADAFGGTFLTSDANGDTFIPASAIGATSFTIAVPEPTSALGLIGAGTLFLARRRR